ncbi:lysophospholipid acyltransferase family protein [Colwellia psychrerythraea]|uniref:Lipid A biosynthesis acyltransferase n=1 Tax=Colwellia psychrerythraea TaxID=28229 RepID=A0A099KPU9_COLPS|nr:lysophospholipid acyltransferase family protein [Colwellia psychrerythraea]KGJ92799.1 lipid A biosynthesis acyltransferase [Colwellia psychrerythraea]
MKVDNAGKLKTKTITHSKLTLIKQKTSSVLIKLLVRALMTLTRERRKKIITKIGKTILRFAKKTRNRAINNISKAMPELSIKEATQLAFDAYGNCAFGLAESFWLSQVEPDIFCDEETLQILQSGTGACIATMHIGCYEAVPLAVAKFAKPSVTLTNIPDFLEDAIDFYSDVNITAINKNSANAFSELLTRAGNNAYISLHCDLYANQTEVSFFGQKTKAPAGVALLAKMTKNPLLLAYAVYQDDGQVQVFFETLKDERSDEQMSEPKNEQSVEQVMAKIYQRFEKIIRQYPSQWYWSYNRWKN